MEVYEAMKRRVSVRAFEDEPVAEEKLERIFEAVRQAPSARNAQEWRFVVVGDRETRRRLAFEAAGQQFMADAAFLIAACAETDGRVMRCGQTAYPIDIAIAVDHLSLAAVAEGLGTCWIGSFEEGIVKKILGIPPAVRVVILIALGRPRLPDEARGKDVADAPNEARRVEKKRLTLSEIMHYERW